MELGVKKSLKAKKQENLEAAKKSWEQGELVACHFPLVFYLEPTSICNLSCPMCPVAMGVSEYEYPEKYISVELVEKLQEPLAYGRRVFLSGGGEPLLHKQFMEIVERMKQLELEVIFNTNATLVDYEVARNFVHLGVDCISVSIDAIDPERYREIRKGARLEQVLEGLKLILNERKKRGITKPLINMQFTLMKDNLNELPRLADFAYKYLVNHLVVEPLSPIFSFDPKYQEFFKAHFLTKTPDLVKQLKDIAKQAQSLRFYFSSHYLEDKRLPRRCGQPWINFGVRTNGRVFLCCGTSEKMGSLAENDFAQIWNGKEYQFFRESIGSGKYPQACQLCLEESRSPWFNHDLLEK